MAKPSADELARIQQIITTDPQLQTLLQRPRPKVGGASKGATGKALSVYWRPVMDRLEALGAPLPHDYLVSKDNTLTRDSWLGRNMDWLGPTIIAGLTLGTSLIPTAVVAGPAAGGAAPGVAAANAIPTVGVGSAAGVSAGTTAGTTAAVAAPSLWRSVASAAIPAAIQGTTNLLGTKYQVDANQRAADTAAKAAEEALKWQKDVYQQRQTQLAPTIGVGNAATYRLADLMGLKTPEGGYQAPPPPGGPPPSTAPVPTSGQPPTAPAAQSSPQGVVMVTPDGRRILVPQDRVQDALSKGAKAA